MRRTCLFVTLLGFAFHPCHAVAGTPWPYSGSAEPPQELALDERIPAAEGTFYPTYWLGGDDGNCAAYLNGLWDWDHVVSDSMHCWLTTEGSTAVVLPEATWRPWIENAGVTSCPLSGNALGFVDLAGSPYWPPGLPAGLWQAVASGAAASAGYGPPVTNTTLVQYDAFLWLPQATGSFYRCGYSYYPYEGLPLWSPRLGDNVWYYTSSNPSCGTYTYNASQAHPPIPAQWDSVRFVFELWCSCDAFGLPPTICTQEGNTRGSPLLDNVRVGLTYVPDAPQISLLAGLLFLDGFGQNHPTYLEPLDVANANVAYDLGLSNPACNVWLADSAVVNGPLPLSESTRWLVNLCFKIARKGARQDWIPAYADWKARLAGDPEIGFVSVLMDSAETGTGVANPRRFATYFHENDPGFEAGAPDYSPANEILPDGVFTPGTRIEYYYAAFWYRGGAPPAEYYILGPFEFAVLPTMVETGGAQYDVEWPSVLYIDADNTGSERFIGPALAGLGLSFDRYDHITSSDPFGAPLRRSHGGVCFNPGGYGNNGCTLDQLLGYRLIFINTGRRSSAVMKAADFELLADWLASTACGVAEIRRGLVLTGAGMARLMLDPATGLAPDFARYTLGVDLADPSYRSFNNDPHPCIYIEPQQPAVFEPLSPGIGFFDDAAVLGLQPGVPEVAGSLRYHCSLGGCNEPYVDHAQVVRVQEIPGIANWRSVVDGFSPQSLSERYCAGEDCSRDTACVIAGIEDLLGPQIEWLAAGAEPFTPWIYPCSPVAGVDEGGATHTATAATYLYPCRPNPFHRRAEVRFQLARPGRVELDIYDAAGRRIRALVNEDLAAGEHRRVWDATDQNGNPAGAGVSWVQLRTGSDPPPSRRMLILR